MYLREQSEGASIQIELSALHQLHNGYGCNGLSDATEAKQRLRRHRLALLDIGKAVASCENKSSIPGDGKGGSRKVVRLHECEECALDLFESRRRICGLSARLT